MIPSLKVVEIKPAQFIATSIPQGDTYQAGDAVLSRRAHFSDWDEEEE